MVDTPTDDARARASDPSTPQTDLAQLAHAHESLRAAIAANPSSYAGLRDWIYQNPGSASVSPVAQASGSAALERFRLRTWPRRIVYISAVTVFGLLTAGGIAAIAIGAATLRGDEDSSAPGDISIDSGDGEVVADEEPVVPAVGVEPPPYVPTVLIIDASGSMVREASTGGTRMEAARSAAITFVNGLGSGAQVGLTVFGTGTGNEDSDRAAGCFDIKRVIPVGAVDKALFTGAIASIVESGFTPLGPAVVDAAAQLGSTEPGLIVLVSDGVDTCSPPPACEVAAKVRAENPNLTIHTIGFNVDADEEAQAQLECIARVGGGEYVDAGNAAQLAARLRALSDPVSVSGALSARGLDTLRLGMSLDRAMASDPSIVLGNVVLDIQYAKCESGTLMFKAGRLWGIQPLAAVLTAEGVRVGDSLSLATDIYGAGEANSDTLGSFVQVTTSRGSDSGYRFYIDPANVIKRIIVCLCGSGGTGVSEMSAWEVSFDGIGPIKFGMTVDEVLEIAPFAQILSGNGCDLVDLAPAGVGADISVVVSPERGVQFVFVSAEHSDVSVLPRLSRGLGIGSSLSDAEAVYPELTVIDSTQFPRYGAMKNVRGVSQILRTTDGAVIDVLQVGKFGEPIYEVCHD